jgi:hypothetical protein
LTFRFWSHFAFRCWHVRGEYAAAWHMLIPPLTAESITISWLWWHGFLGTSNLASLHHSLNATDLFLTFRSWSCFASPVFGTRGEYAAKSGPPHHSLDVSDPPAFSKS